MILVVNPMINFTIYESLKKELILDNIGLSAYYLLISSFISKTIATMYTYPFLTVRVRL